jgi:hypothetical protein
LRQTSSNPLLTRQVVADNAVAGGQRGRGAEAKEVPISAVELDDNSHPLDVCFHPIPGLESDAPGVGALCADPTANPFNRQREPRPRRCARRRRWADRGPPAPIQRDRCLPEGQSRSINPHVRDPGAQAGTSRPRRIRRRTRQAGR